MPANIREFHRASTIPQALEQLTRTDLPVAALVVAPRLPDAPFAQTEAVVDVQSLPLHSVAFAREQLRLGGLVDLQTLLATSALGALADGILSEAVTLAAHFGLRNLATVAGAIDGALGVPPGPPELLLALLALGAEYTLLDGTSTQAPLATYRPAQQTLLAGVAIPTPSSWHAALARVARTPRDQAIVAAVAAVSPATTRVAVAGASTLPIVVETATTGERASAVTRLVADLAAQVAPQGDYRGSVEYRRAMVEVLARRALSQAFSNEANA